jgi:hypothetical protein
VTAACAALIPLNEERWTHAQETPANRGQAAAEGEAYSRAKEAEGIVIVGFVLRAGCFDTFLS